MRTELCQFLQSLRHRAGFSTALLAHVSGLAPSTLRRWESGRYQPRLAELHRLLQALQVSPEQTARAVALLQAPRAQRHLLAASAALGPLLEAVSECQPGAGDLWQALRSRRGWTRKQVAVEMGVSPSTVTRWEQSRVAVPPERFEALCALLQALPLEREALRARRLFLAPPLEIEPATLEACEARIGHLSAAMERGECLLGDLEFLRLEAALWLPALRPTGASRLLALAYVWHAEWLLRRGRWQEMNAYAHRALELAPQTGKPESFWLRAEGMCAIYLAHGPGRRRPGQGVELRRNWLDVATRLGDETGSFRDMAGYAAECGQFEASRHFIAQAHNAAQRFDAPDPLKLSRFIHARILLLAGQPDEALAYLPSQEDSRPIQRASDQLLWTQTLLSLGEKAEAHRWLTRFYATVEAYDLGHRRSEGDRLARLL